MNRRIEWFACRGLGFFNELSLFQLFWFGTVVVADVGINYFFPY
jgi:hypothetical protein